MKRTFLGAKGIQVLCAVIFLFVKTPAVNSAEKKCLWVNSYHKGYIWNNLIESGLVPKLKGICSLEIFYMDTKKNPDDEFSIKRGLEAKQQIEAKKPDLVFVSDDNATRDLLVPHYKDSKIPFVFLGVKWSVNKYNLPFSNTTGIIATMPMQGMIQELLRLLSNNKKIVYVSASDITSMESYKNMKKMFENSGLQLDHIIADQFEDWKKAIVKAQDWSALFIGGNGSIQNWDDKEALAHMEKNNKKFVFTNATTTQWLSMIAVQRVPQELGECAADAASKILSGTSPKDIPITTNKKFETYINNRMISKSPFKLSDSFLKKAKEMKDHK